MKELWIPLKDIPASGQEWHFTDQSLWSAPMQEFSVSGRIAKPFSARLLVVPQREGFLISGEFSGSLIVPCSRCAEEFELPLSGSFEDYFGPEPEGEAEEEDGDAAEEAPVENHLRLTGGRPELDAAGLLWEQFVLVLPENPVCSEKCRGLCPQCGANLNKTRCGCTRDEGDPRLSVLRNLKLQ